jgi:mannose-6-phosphate isomerase-like protein (cupin superfamily)
MSSQGKIEREGFALAHLDDLGEGYGFRKIRKELGVTAFGMNAIVIPPGYATGKHFHEEQEETYFVHQGTVEFVIGTAESEERFRLGPGGVIRVDADTVRQIVNVGNDDAVYVIAGGKDGYVGRDGRLPEGETREGSAGPPGAA